MADVTRRGFINLVGRAGGAAAPYNTLGAMGLLAAPGAHARRAPRQLPDPLGGREGDVLDVTHVHQLIVARQLRARPDVPLVPEDILVRHDAVACGHDESALAGVAARMGEATSHRWEKIAPGLEDVFVSLMGKSEDNFQ